MAMQKQLIQGTKIITYTERRNCRSKGIRVAVHPDGRVLVTAPPRASMRMIESFLQARFEWILTTIDRHKDTPAPFLHTGTKQDYMAHKEAARVLAKERLEYFNAYYRLAYKTISIKNQRTRWGSCSKKGNLNFNYKIALLPARLCDYIIVHELCHLAELNHSKKFWQLMSLTLPDHAQRRRELQQYTGKKEAV